MVKEAKDILKRWWFKPRRQGWRIREAKYNIEVGGPPRGRRRKVKEADTGHQQ